MRKRLRYQLSYAQHDLCGFTVHIKVDILRAAPFMHKVFDSVAFIWIRQT